MEDNYICYNCFCVIICQFTGHNLQIMKINGKAVVYGILAGVGILAFYILVLSIFQSYGFALYEFKRLWIWLVPLSIGFGAQIGLYTSIRHDAIVNSGVAASGTISGGSMVVCCSHYLLTMIPFIGITGLGAFTSFLMEYQKAFFSIGILSSVIGIVSMIRHKNKMRGMI